MVRGPIQPWKVCKGARIIGMRTIGMRTIGMRTIGIRIIGMEDNWYAENWHGGQLAWRTIIGIDFLNYGVSNLITLFIYCHT